MAARLRFMGALAVHASGQGIITTVAGNGTVGFSGDGGQAANAQLCRTAGVSVDSSRCLVTRLCLVTGNFRGSASNLPMSMRFIHDTVCELCMRQSLMVLRYKAEPCNEAVKIEANLSI